MPKLNDLKDLYVEHLKDLYSAETQLLEALPKLAAAAHDQTLKSAFEEHLGQTRVHVQRLESLGQALNQALTGHTCKAMKGIIAEGQDMVNEDAAPAVKDAGLMAAAQRAEYYEITGYGTAARFADLLGETEQARVLRTTEQEEKDTDATLMALSEKINKAALAG